jgi:hypothetical protein
MTAIDETSVVYTVSDRAIILLLQVMMRITT